ncbi:MAG: orotidine-5'-phosphate decarboxylase [Candidatus Solibacter usitatus]|nr:orotidine-5'-phosphate decarboxylase [Candidatus Solibacter usitatus]
MTENPIIVALDVPSAAEAREIVNRLGPAIGFYKVGLELFAAEGPDFVKELVAQGKRVFVDLKMYDIHETVKRAAASVAALGASLLTVHASPQVVRAAKEGTAGSGLKILAVTVLTSFDQDDLEDIGVAGRTVAEQVQWLAGKAIEAGADGLVCSPLEVERLRALCGPGTILLVPGVRSAGADRGDQKRVATPAEAMRRGATYLVVGREITRAADPTAAAARIMAAIKETV